MLEHVFAERPSLLEVSSEAFLQHSRGMLRHVDAECNLARIMSELACGPQAKLPRSIAVAC